MNSQRHLRRSRPSGYGFSMIELVAVIVVIGVMSAAAIPALSSTATMRSRLAARQLAKDVSFARERSVATGTRTWVVFSAGTESYSMLAENPAAPGRAGAAALTDPATGSAFSVVLNAGDFAGVTITSASFGAGSEVGFDWLGRPKNSAEADLAANGTVVVSGGHTISVQVGTGLVFLSP